MRLKWSLVLGYKSSEELIRHGVEFELRLASYSTNCGHLVGQILQLLAESLPLTNSLSPFLLVSEMQTLHASPNLLSQVIHLLDYFTLQSSQPLPDTILLSRQNHEGFGC